MLQEKIGSIGSRLIINGETYFIGDVVLLTHRKTLKKTVLPINLE